MKIFIIGHSGSGKSTIARLITENSEVNRIRTFTTRPRRVNEGLDDYIFVDPSELPELNLVAVRKYDTFINDFPASYTYGVRRSDMSLNGHHVVITDAEGYLDLVDTVVPREDAILLFLNVDKDTLRSRAATRPDFSAGEWERRYATDNDSLSLDRLTMLALSPSSSIRYKIYILDANQSVEDVTSQALQILLENLIEVDKHLLK